MSELERSLKSGYSDEIRLKTVTEGMVKERVFEAPFEGGPEGEHGLF